MIICLNIERSTKEQMDHLIQSGEYRDYSELVSLAVGNQFLFHDSAGKTLIPSQGARTPIVVEPKVVTPPAIEVNVPLQNGSTTLELSSSQVLPEVFRLARGLKQPGAFAQLPNDAFAVGMDVPVDRWIFGQHNKLLPVKANVRALANLLRNESNAAGLPLDRASAEIASAAVIFGDMLRTLDSRSEKHRDDALGIAFPSSDPANNDKSRLRYATQFVGTMSREGRMTGMLVDLKLVNHDRHKSPRVLLTEEGWRFALMPNPIIDGPDRDLGCKFSEDETEFMLSHIATAIPTEYFAFKATLSAITSGSDSPEALDAALRKYLPERKDKPFTDAFLTTQRAGVISRMADLGLVIRNRSGSNVAYAATARGELFIERGH